MNENDEIQLYEYEKGWGDMMVDMWREQLRLLNTIDTGALYASFSATVTDGDTTTIEHQFAEYGMAVAAGTGYGYKRGNGGNLPFLDPAYRHEHRLDVPRKVGPAWGGRMTSGNPREAKPWFQRKYWYSLMRLNEHLQDHYGDTSQQLIVSALDAFAGDDDGRMII